MYPTVTSVEVKEDYILKIQFDSGEQGVLDMKPYLNFGVFHRIKDAAVFGTARVAFDTIEWETGVDLDPEFVYQKSVKLNRA